MKLTKTVVKAQAPIRVSANHEAGLDTEALFGETVTIGQRKNGFIQVKLNIDGYSGWMPSDCLGKMPAANHMVIAPHSFVTSKADLKSFGLGSLSLGARLHVYKSISTCPKSPFVEIEFSDARGFVPRVHLMSINSYCEDWVAVAESLIGSPYCWGGRTSTGLDCSALVQLSMAAAGKHVPRDSGPQHDIGIALHGTGKLQRGDLVFWRGHVGIMRDSNLLLHANAHHMAVASEPLNVAEERISAEVGPITALRRP